MLFCATYSCLWAWLCAHTTMSTRSLFREDMLGPRPSSQAPAAFDTEVNLRVSRGDSHTLPVTVTAGSRLHWRFQVEDHDIAFSVTFTTDDGTSARVASVQPRLRLKHEQSSFLAERPGVVALTWDNSYSRFRGKNIVYSVCVEADDSEEHPLVDTPYGPGLMVEYRDEDQL